MGRSLLYYGCRYRPIFKICLKFILQLYTAPDRHLHRRAVTTSACCHLQCDPETRAAATIQETLCTCVLEAGPNLSWVTDYPNKDFLLFSSASLTHTARICDDRPPPSKSLHMIFFPHVIERHSLEPLHLKQRR
jgi:hypothetical protein